MGYLKYFFLVLVCIFLLAINLNYSHPKRSVASDTDLLNNATNVIKLKEHSYQLYAGLIFEQDPKTKEWIIYHGEGLPFDIQTDRPFENLHYLTDLWGDWDALLARDQAGRIYTLESRPTTRYKNSEHVYTWSNVWGTPVSGELYLPHEIYPSTHLAFARRTAGNVGFVEDGAGIKHAAGGNSSLIISKNHPTGESGLIHIYALSPDGSRLRFADTGLPVGINYEFELPYDGQIIGESISASGSVVMLLSKDGRIYTKFLDFDFSGHNPMMFNYTYDWSDFKDNTKIKKYDTIALPTKDWLEHSEVPTGEQGEMTNEIKIETVGFGNDSKKLKVYGKNDQGECGYFEKLIKEQEWKFFTTDYCTDSQKIIITKEIVLNQLNTINHDLPLSIDKEIWNLKIKNYRLAGTEFAIELSSPKHKAITGKLHQLFTWSPFPIIDPGNDGRPKLYQATITFDSKQNISNKILKKINYKTFALTIYATKNSINIRSKDKKIYGESIKTLAEDYQEYLLKTSDGDVQKIQHLHEERIQILKQELKTITLYTVLSYPIEALTSLLTIRFWNFPIADLPPAKRILDVGLEIIRYRMELIQKEIKIVEEFKTPK